MRSIKAVVCHEAFIFMIISSRNIAWFLATALTGLVLSVSVKAFALESEISQVTLFVEGMMKSRGGVT